MADLNELSAKYQHKKQLEQRYEALLEETKEAAQAVAKSQAACEEENLDLRKFESNDFKQFWLKLRGQYEERLLENNEKAAQAMKILNDAKTHAFDVEKEIEAVRLELKALVGVEDAYEEALAKRIEHLDYSVHRDEIIRMQERISYDEYQEKCVHELLESTEIAQRGLADLMIYFHQMDLDGDGLLDITDELQLKFITGCAELRVRLHQMELLITEIDAMEVENIKLVEKFDINTLDLFFTKGTSGLQKLATKKATHSLKLTRDTLAECENAAKALAEDIMLTKEEHQKQLEKFISETTV